MTDMHYHCPHCPDTVYFAPGVCDWHGAALSPDPTPEMKNRAALGYATRLACSLWGKHYREDAPNWRPCDDLMGVLTQIDNMLTGLGRTVGVTVVNPTDPGHAVEILREQVRHLERRIRELHAERNAGVEGRKP